MRTIHSIYMRNLRTYFALQFSLVMDYLETGVAFE